MSVDIGILNQNELNVDYDKLFSDVISRGARIHYMPLHHTHDPAIVAEKARGFDYVVAGRERWDAAALEACSDRLKLIARFGTGYDTIDLEAATRLGIAVSNSPGKNARSVAEHALAMTLSLLRRIDQYDRQLRREPVRASLSHSLEGTFGLLGFGNIAKNFARLLQPFDVKIIAHDLIPDMETASRLNVEMVSLDQLFEQSDIISCHLPLTEKTSHILRKENLDKMKTGAFLINTSRGGIQCERDIIDALKQEKLAGAAFDVFEKEPFSPDNELAALDNVILTPHAAAVSTQGVRDVLEYCVSVITRFDRGETVDTILNPDYIKHI